jgi:hypothetical protein
MFGRRRGRARSSRNAIDTGERELAHAEETGCGTGDADDN